MNPSFAQKPAASSFESDAGDATIELIATMPTASLYLQRLL